MRAKRTACLTVLPLVAAALLPAQAGAAVLDRVQVGVPGTSTRAFSENLSVALRGPAPYERACCTDFVTGAWEGPRARAGGTDQNRSRIDWSVSFARGKSVRSLARGAGWADFPQLSGRRQRVTHRVAGRKVGTLTGYAAVDVQDLPGARTQAALAINLGKRTAAVALFDLGTPAADTSSAGSVTVDGRPASDWNRAQAGAALKGVYIEGSLPPAKVTARWSGSRALGRVSDAFGHPVAGVKVELQQRVGGSWKTAKSGFASSRGTFSLRARKRPSRVVATLGGSKARGSVR
jgi:hypothetical protein